MSDDSRKEEILINVTPSETRAALLENGVLQEIFIERAMESPSGLSASSSPGILPIRPGGVDPPAD